MNKLQKEIADILPDSPDKKELIGKLEAVASNFANQFSLWTITYGKQYIDARSPKFDAKHSIMTIFKKVYGTKWLKLNAGKSNSKNKRVS